MLSFSWHNHLSEQHETEDTNDMDISWSAFHASNCDNLPDTFIDTSSLLHLFYEEAKSTAMIRHAMSIVKESVNFLNHGQIPVLTCDQPLFAIAKSIQWNWPEHFSEQHIVLMFGGLHIELAALRTIGDWFEDYGWTSALCQANVASAGTADSFLKASHITRTRHAHEVTACTLHILMQRSYKQYIDEQNHNVSVSFDEWREEREIKNPVFIIGLFLSSLS